MEFIDEDIQTWEYDILPKLAKNSSLGYFKHHGFWQCMDTLRDKNTLESYWLRNKAPWKVW